MSLDAPTTAEVSNNLLAQLESSLSQTAPLLPKAVLRVLAKVMAGVFILLYRYAGFIFLQLFVAHASTRETAVGTRTVIPLVEWGRLIGVGDPEPATRAELVVRVGVELQTGSLPAGAQLVFPSTGVIYITTTATPLDAATKDVTVRAVSDPSDGGGAGAVGNVDVGETLSFASPLSNVSRSAEVISQAVVGADGESWDVYRARIIRRFQRPPQGGAYADYQAWGEEGAGILNVYPYTGAPGEVDVYVEATVASSGSADGIPTSGQLEAVRDLIDMDEDGKATRRNANAAVNVLPIVRTAFDVTIGGLVSDDVVAARAAIEAALDEYLRSREPFIVGLSVLPRRDRITLAAVSGVADEAASAAGASIVTVALSEGGGSVSARSLQQGEKAKLGTPNFA